MFFKHIQYPYLQLHFLKSFLKSNIKIVFFQLKDYDPNQSNTKI